MASVERKVVSVLDVGDIVRARRRELGITQAQLAQFCGTGNRFISELERGKQTLEMGKVLLVLRKLEINITIEY